MASLSDELSSFEEKGCGGSGEQMENQTEYGLNTNNNSEYTAATDVEFPVDVGEPFKTTRKRKLDDEGFVTPATPDIPKSSSKYEMPSGNVEMQRNDDYLEYYDYDKVDGDGVTGFEEENPLYKTQVYKSAADLIKDIAEECKMRMLEWSSELSESETFESFCASRLDRLVTDAKDLEDSLNKQKDLLRKRLGFISRTLQDI
ncbi:hypothetical protein SNE40_023329 [Patella caerulea]|uniref:Uncharacterized protein n=1 Tax=Patella caerulea TaxID=87958 RepID=A0AAN8GHW7_PATCE